MHWTGQRRMKQRAVLRQLLASSRTLTLVPQAALSLSAQQRLTGVAVQADVHAEVLVRGVVRHEAVLRPEQEGAGVLSVRVLGKERAVWVIRHTLHKQSQSTRPRQLASIRVEAPVAFDIVVEGTNASMHGLPRRTLDACV